LRSSTEPSRPHTGGVDNIQQHQASPSATRCQPSVGSPLTCRGGCTLPRAPPLRMLDPHTNTQARVQLASESMALGSSSDAGNMSSRIAARRRASLAHRAKRREQKVPTDVGGRHNEKLECEIARLRAMRERTEAKLRARLLDLSHPTGSAATTVATGEAVDETIQQVVGTRELASPEERSGCSLSHGAAAIVPSHLVRSAQEPANTSGLPYIIVAPEYGRRMHRWMFSAGRAQQVLRCLDDSPPAVRQMLSMLLARLLCQSENEDDLRDPPIFIRGALAPRLPQATDHEKPNAWGGGLRVAPPKPRDLTGETPQETARQIWAMSSMAACTETT
jgi:hypothetical protein